MTAPTDSKAGQLPDLFPFLRDHAIGNVPSLLLAAASGTSALLVGMPLMRLSGLAAGIATFAVLGITHNVLRYWTKVWPGPQTLALVPETTGVLQAAVGAMIAVVVAFAYQRSRLGRLLRATREDPAAAQAAGIDVHRQRLVGVRAVGCAVGLRRRPLVHEIGTITTDAGLPRADVPDARDARRSAASTSLWGAVVGALSVSGLDSFLGDAEDGLHVVGLHVDFPAGRGSSWLGAVMALVLILRRPASPAVASSRSTGRGDRREETA